MKKQVDILSQNQKPVLSQLPEGVFDYEGRYIAHGPSSYENKPVRISVRSSFLGIPIGEKREDMSLGPINPQMTHLRTALVFEDRGSGYEDLVVSEPELFRIDDPRTFARYYQQENGRHSLVNGKTINFSIREGLLGLVKTDVTATLIK